MTERAHYAGAVDRSATRFAARAHLSRSGALRDRPVGTLAGDPELARYLRALARLDTGGPLGFVWLGASGRGASGAALGRFVRVTAWPGSTPSGGYDIELESAEPNDLGGLSGRELQVLTLLACGLTNPAIAVRLDVSRSTATTHVERLMTKLEVSSRVSAAIVAVDRGLLALPISGADLGGLGAMAVVRIEAEARGGPAPPIVPRPRMTRPRPLVVGTVHPALGDSAWDGQQMRQGAQLAIAEINRRGGVGGRSLQLLAVGADVTRRESVALAVEQLVEQDVDAITVGYTFERHGGALAEQFGPAAAGRCPLLHHSTSVRAARLVSDEPDRFGHVFQVCAREEVYGTGFVRMLTDLRDSGTWIPRSRRLHVVDSTAPDLRTFPAAAVDAADRAGWTVSVDDEGVTGSDWSAVMARLRGVDPAAVMVTCFSPALLADFVKEFRREPVEALVYGLYSPSVPGFLERAGAAADGLLWATVTGLYNDSFGRGFARRFRDHHGSVPGMSSAGIHYDMVSMLAAAWSRCARPRDFDEVVDQLRRGIHRGVNGSYHFGRPDQTGLVYPDDTLDASIAQAHLVYQVQDGRHRIIAPAPYASASFRLPTWCSSADRAIADA
jgi:branched-chain amino acid transport system substrate-binding protein